MDGTEERKDTSQVGDSSGDTKGTSETPETFTKESQDKAISDALSTAGRSAQTLEKREQAIKATEDAQVRAKDKAYQDARAAVMDNTEELSALEAKHKLEEVTTNLASVEQELEDWREKGKQREAQEAESTKERNAREIAERLNVDPKLLGKLAKTTDGSKEAIEAEAQDLPRLSGKTPLKLDSSKTIGGSDWRDLSPDEKVKRGLSRK